MGRVVCVLGMHRSGTSLVARLLNLLGVDLGPADTLRKPDQFNPTGFWEQEQFIDFNDEILRRLGGTWRELPRRVAGWERAPEFDDLLDDARHFVTEKFAGVACWGWKDPRTCVTLPFWQRVVPDLTYVVCLRNPVDVAHSLEHTMSFKKAGRLWHSYVTSSLIHTTGRERLCVFYEDCLNQLHDPLKRLAEFLGVADRLHSAESQAQAAEFVDAQREHHRTSPPGVIQERRLSFASKALYAALRLSVPGAANGAAPLFWHEMIDALGYRSLEAHHVHLANRAKIARQAVEIQNAQRLVTQGEAERARQRTAYEQQVANERAAREKLSAEHQRADSQRRAEFTAIQAELERRGRVLRRLRRRLRKTSQQADRNLQERLVALAETLDARHRRSRTRKSRRKSSASTLMLAPVDYPTLVERIQRVAKAKLPTGAKVLVVSKGDDELLRLGSAVGRHFPHDAAGDYSGFHPLDSEAAIQTLETARSEGAEFLVFPQTAFWWLDHYQQFKEHLDKRYRLHVEEPGVCLIYELRSGPSGSSRSRPRRLAAWPTPAANERPAHCALADQVGEVVRALLPDGASVLMASGGDDELCHCCDAKHFPQDEQGEYAGERLSDTAAMIAQLDALAAAGAQYLVVPRSGFDWLEQDGLFARHLRTHYRQITFQRNVCAIFALSAAKRASPRPAVRNSGPSATFKPAGRANKARVRQKG